MSALLDAQCEFAEDVGKLIAKVKELGLRCKLGEALRFKETQELWVKMGKSQTFNSLHLQGLALDLLLFRGDTYLTNSSDYETLGVWWENLRPGLNVWGGRWKMSDGNHFQRNRP